MPAVFIERFCGASLDAGAVLVHELLVESEWLIERYAAVADEQEPVQGTGPAQVFGSALPGCAAATLVASG